MTASDSTRCRNCGHEGVGRYCSECGQRSGDVRVSMRSLIADVLEDQLSLTSALPRTLALLFVHPGRLTEHYLNGRIASYIAPFRLYLAASLVFFLTLSLLTRSSSVRAELQVTTPRGDSAAAGPGAPSVPAGTQGDRTGFGVTTGNAPQDSIDTENGFDINTGIPTLDRITRERIRELSAQGNEEAARTILASTLQRAPTAMFVMLPVFALLLGIFYFRLHRYYVEHFVFSLHYHTFAFVLFTVMLLLEKTFIPAILGIWLVLYLPIALRRVYGQGWLVTVPKAILISLSYSVLLGIGIAGTLVVAVLLA